MARAGFRLRLRTLLILLVVGGALAGLAGRLLQRDPQVFIESLVIVTTIGPFLAAVVTLIVLGVKERRRPLLLWGALLVATPIVGMIAATGLRSMARGPGGLGMLSTGRIIHTELPSRIDEPWVWDELTRRLNARDLSAEQVNQAILTLAEQMRLARPQGWDQPLDRQDRFLTPAVQSGMVQEETLVALADAFYGGEARLGPLRRLREGDAHFELDVQFGSVWAQHSDVLPRLVWDVGQVTIDGRPVAIRKVWRNPDDWRGAHEGDDLSLAPGEHELRVEVDALYVPAGQMVGLQPNELTPATAPQGIKRWKKTLIEKLVVHGKDKPLVRLLTKPANLKGGHGVSVERLLVQKLGDGRKKIVLVVNIDNAGGPDVSFDAAVQVDDELIPLEGQVVHADLGGGRRIGGGQVQLQATVPSLISDATQARVVLTPEPTHVEQHPGVDAIWGAPVTIPGVRMERLDRLAQPSDSEGDRFDFAE